MLIALKLWNSRTSLFMSRGLRCLATKANSAADSLKLSNGNPGYFLDGWPPGTTEGQNPTLGIAGMNDETTDRLKWKAVKYREEFMKCAHSMRVNDLDVARNSTIIVHSSNNIPRMVRRLKYVYLSLLYRRHEFCLVELVLFIWSYILQLSTETCKSSSSFIMS